VSRVTLRLWPERLTKPLASKAPSRHTAVSVEPTVEHCPELFRILGAYLHQDWTIDYETAEEALGVAIAEAPDARIMAAAAELRRSRPSPEDEEASRQFANRLCFYHPPGDGLTYSAWLDRVQHLLDEPRT